MSLPQTHTHPRTQQRVLTGGIGDEPIELLRRLITRASGVLGVPPPLPPRSPPSTASRPESKLLDGVTFRWKGFSGRVNVLDGVVGVEGVEVG